MTKLVEVKIADARYEEDLFNLCMDLWDENGIFPVSPDKVRGFIRLATGVTPRAPTDAAPLIGVIGEPGKIEGAIALVVSQLWYADTWHIEELWNFVRPEYRRSTNAKSLIEFSKGVQAKLNIPLLIGILSSERTEAKERLYQRQLGDKAGVYFVYPTWSALKAEQHAAA